jgi:hypothetical protein
MRSNPSRTWLAAGLTAAAGALLAVCPFRAADDARAAGPAFAPLAARYTKDVRPLLQRYCGRCHSRKKHEGDIDLMSPSSLADVRKTPRTWQKVLEVLEGGQMPPDDARQPAAAERALLLGWVRGYLKEEARALAGDPGPVVLRRLSNAEYTYTVRDLTGVDLQPARQFPVDGAAGEGFTNNGQALAMSPALLAKYLDAAKEIAAHAVLLPDGFRFSASTTRRDHTNEILAQIRQLYREHSDSNGGTRVNLQGIVFDTNAGGRLPVGLYLAATLAERGALKAGTKTLDAVARERGLNARYLSRLWAVLTGPRGSALLDQLRARWEVARPGDAPALAAEVGRWQNRLTQFGNVGHMKPWMRPVTPITSRQEVRYKIPAGPPGKDVTFYLAAGTAGDGPAGDFVVCEKPRLVLPGRPDLPLRDVRAFALRAAAWRDTLFSSAAKCLAAADEAAGQEKPDLARLARAHGVEVGALSAWLNYLGIGPAATPRLNLFTTKLPAGKYAFIQGWGKPETPSLLANSSGRHVRIPGNMKPHGVCVHPSPTLAAAVGWRSPLAGEVRIEGKVVHAHPECGNGVTWSLELRRGATRRRLAAGTAQGGRWAALGPIDRLAVQKGDLLSLLIGPNNRNHSCDLTDLELVVRSAGPGGREWSLTRDVSGDVLAGNPHADRFGNKDVWHFYSEPVKEDAGQAIPAGSSLSRWMAAHQPAEKQKLAAAVQKLLTAGPPADARNPDAVLYRELSSLGGGLLAQAPPAARPGPLPKDAPGVDPALFGKHPAGPSLAPQDLCVRAPAAVAVRLPADLFAGAELVTSAVLHLPSGAAGSAQVRVLPTRPASLTELVIDAPVLTAPAGEARRRWETAFEDFRRLFPAALCYTKIVPVDEVVTLTLFHREDGPLCRLMLDARQKARLDRLWEELHFVSHDALTLVDAYKQLMEFATQDGDPRVFEPYRKPIHDRAAAFRKALLAAEPAQLDAVVEFAGRAYRRNLTAGEKEMLRGLYARLRAEKLSHAAALRLTLARVLVSPAFLYRLEKAPPGVKPGPVSDIELASRLSYFLWSSAPDPALRDLAEKGRLHQPDVLVAEAKRMLKDDRVRRLAVEFGCQWLHVNGFDTLDEKSERHFPTFAALRGPMYEESVRFFTDLFQRDGSVRDTLDADHTFLNEALARHYGIPGVTGPQWRRVGGVKKYGRGGILALGATLAKQSGASRTSPILRGNWVSEVLLGEKLPRPPKDVPQLPAEETGTTLTVRQLVEKHSTDARCAVCHSRIDAFGFALEGFDAIGRRRTHDLADRPIDVKARVKDGTPIDGLDGLRRYLLGKRQGDFLHQFCRKLLGYALGRGVQLSDEPLLEEMQRQLRKNDYRFSAAVEAVVRSPQFRQIRGKDAPVPDAH